MVCGDHGMRDAGGHGGATPSEVLVPLLLARSADFQCPHPCVHMPYFFLLERKLDKNPST